MAAGAWGISVATMHQAKVARAAGISRIMLAHQVLDSTALTWAAAELARDASFEFSWFVDSVEGVQAAAEAGRDHLSRNGFPVILDVGYFGGRTGVRTAPQARALAGAISATEGVCLVGVNGYEGGLTNVDGVRSFFAKVRTVVEDLAASGLLPAAPIVTACGSAYFDLVASDLGDQWANQQGATVILRSGSSITHDNGVYEHKTAYSRIAREGNLQLALQIWVQILSAPELGLALAGMGKRDAPIDEGMPIPLAIRHSGSSDVVDIRGHATVPKMDDQHCYVHLADGLPVRPGDLVCFGISHPCTAFDRWRVIPIVNASDTVVDVVRTYF
ncbi:MAG: alanine racemase [Nakamurella sp.]